MHRRILGLAHIAEFEAIEDPTIRAPCEAKALKLGRMLAVARKSISDFAEIHAVARRLERGEIG
jgi:5-methylthioribose kinase